MMQTWDQQQQQQNQQQPQQQQGTLQGILSSGSLSFNGSMTKEDEEMSKSALTTFRAKEEEIEKKKLEIREKVQAQLGRVEEETKRLAAIRLVPNLALSFLCLLLEEEFTWLIQLKLIFKTPNETRFSSLIRNT